jgi:hypothetical protein
VLSVEKLGYRMEVWVIELPFPEGVTNPSLFESVKTEAGAHTAIYSMGNRNFSPV